MKEYVLMDSDGNLVVGVKIAKAEVGVEADRFEYDSKNEYWTIKDGTKFLGMEWTIVFPGRKYEFLGEL